MPKRALIEHRPWLLASLVAGVAYYFLWNNPIGGLWLILLKGAGVGLLAVYVLRQSHGIDSTILAVALAFSAVADMVLEINFAAGGALFLASHCVALALYVRNHQDTSSARQKAFAAALFIGTPVGVMAAERARGRYAVFGGAGCDGSGGMAEPVSPLPGRAGCGAVHH